MNKNFVDNELLSILIDKGCDKEVSRRIAIICGEKDSTTYSEVMSGLGYNPDKEESGKSVLLQVYTIVKISIERGLPPAQWEWNKKECVWELPEWTQEVSSPSLIIYDNTDDIGKFNTYDIIEKEVTLAIAQDIVGSYESNIKFSVNNTMTEEELSELIGFDYPIRKYESALQLGQSALIINSNFNFKLITRIN